MFESRIHHYWQDIIHHYCEQRLSWQDASNSSPSNNSSYDENLHAQYNEQGDNSQETEESNKNTDAALQVREKEIYNILRTGQAPQRETIGSYIIDYLENNGAIDIHEINEFQNRIKTELKKLGGGNTEVPWELLDTEEEIIQFGLYANLISDSAYRAVRKKIDSGEISASRNVKSTSKSESAPEDFRDLRGWKPVVEKLMQSDREANLNLFRELQKELNKKKPDQYFIRKIDAHVRAVAADVPNLDLLSPRDMHQLKAFTRYVIAVLEGSSQFAEGQEEKSSQPSEKRNATRANNHSVRVEYNSLSRNEIARQVRAKSPHLTGDSLAKAVESEWKAQFRSYEEKELNAPRQQSFYIDRTNGNTTYSNPREGFGPDDPYRGSPLAPYASRAEMEKYMGVQDELREGYIPELQQFVSTHISEIANDSKYTDLVNAYKHAQGQWSSNPERKYGDLAIMRSQIEAAEKSREKDGISGESQRIGASYGIY